MTLNPSYNSCTPIVLATDKDNGKEDIPPVTPPATEFEEYHATPTNSGIDAFVSSINFLPPTPESTPKTISMCVPNSKNSSPIPIPAKSTTYTSSLDTIHPTSPPTPTPTSKLSRPTKIIFSATHSVPTATPSSAPAVYSAPLISRDRYDLNYELTHYQTLEFYRKWTSHFDFQLRGMPIIYNANSPHTINTPTQSQHSFPSRSGYPNELEITLKQRKIEIAKAEMNALIKVLLDTSPQNPDTLLYRVHTSETKSLYTPGLGIRCTDWVSSLKTNIPSAEQVSGRAFQDHCNAVEKPTPYISVHKSVARLIKYITSYRWDECPDVTVYIISLNRLKKLGIKATCTNDMLYSFLDSGQPTYRKNGKNIWTNGVSFVTNSHWLVDQWVPDQAIVSEVDVQRFLRIAEEEGISAEIIKNNKNYWDKNLEARKIPVSKWPERMSGVSVTEDSGIAELESSISKLRLVGKV